MSRYDSGYRVTVSKATNRDTVITATLHHNLVTAYNNTRAVLGNSAAELKKDSHPGWLLITLEGRITRPRPLNTNRSSTCRDSCNRIHLFVGNHHSLSRTVTLRQRPTECEGALRSHLQSMSLMLPWTGPLHGSCVRPATSTTRMVETGAHN